MEDQASDGAAECAGADRASKQHHGPKMGQRPRTGSLWDDRQHAHEQRVPVVIEGSGLPAPWGNSTYNTNAPSISKREHVALASCYFPLLLGLHLNRWWSFLYCAMVSDEFLIGLRLWRLCRRLMIALVNREAAKGKPCTR